MEPVSVPVVHISEVTASEDDEDKHAENDDVTCTNTDDVTCANTDDVTCTNTDDACEDTENCAPSDGNHVSSVDDAATIRSHPTTTPQEGDKRRLDGEMEQGGVSGKRDDVEEGDNLVADEEEGEDGEEEEEDEEPQMSAEEKKALCDAVVSSNIDLADELLLQPGADINMEWFGENLLMAAIRAHRPAMAEWLIDNGADHNFTKTIVDMKNETRTEIETYTTDCRQMAYECGLSDIVDLIDEKNDLSWPFIRKRQRTVRFRTMLIEDSSEDEEENSVIDLCDDEDEELGEEERSESGMRSTKARKPSLVSSSKRGSHARSVSSHLGSDLVDGLDVSRPGSVTCKSNHSPRSGTSLCRSSQRSLLHVEGSCDVDGRQSSGYDSLSTVSELSHTGGPEVPSKPSNPHRYRATKTSLSRHRVTQEVLAERAATDSVIELTKHSRSRLLKELGAVEGGPNWRRGLCSRDGSNEEVRSESQVRTRSPYMMDQSPATSVTWHDLSLTRQSSDLRTPIRPFSSVDRWKPSIESGNSFLPILSVIEPSGVSPNTKNKLNSNKIGYVEDFNYLSQKLKGSLTERVQGSETGQKVMTSSRLTLGKTHRHRGRCRSAPAPKFYSPAGFYKGSTAMAEHRNNMRNSLSRQPHLYPRCPLPTET